MADGCQQLHFRLPRAQIGYLRFLVEAYEGLAVVTALPGRAEVRWTVAPGREQEAAELARALRDEISLVPIPRPDDWPSAQ